MSENQMKTEMATAVTELLLMCICSHFAANHKPIFYNLNGFGLNQNSKKEHWIRLFNYKRKQSAFNLMVKVHMMNLLEE